MRIKTLSYNDFNNVATFTANSNSLSVATNSTTNLTSISLTRGKYVVCCYATFQTLVSADIVGSLTQDSGSLGGCETSGSTHGYTTITFTRVVNVDASGSTLYVKVFHKCGQTVTVTGEIKALRVSY